MRSFLTSTLVGGLVFVIPFIIIVAVESLNLKFTSIAKTIQRIGIGSEDFMANIKINEFSS